MTGNAWVWKRTSEPQLVITHEGKVPCLNNTAATHRPPSTFPFPPTLTPLRQDDKLNATPHTINAHTDTRQRAATTRRGPSYAPWKRVYTMDIARRNPSSQSPTPPRNHARIPSTAPRSPTTQPPSLHSAVYPERSRIQHRDHQEPAGPIE
ncbi:hypothetical protein MFRU_015g00860 [Monilinia fructicola]|nr:hypothetical protein MFRU_015g00860 [Monilinia fructicola]